MELEWTEAREEAMSTLRSACRMCRAAIRWLMLVVRVERRYKDSVRLTAAEKEDESRTSIAVWGLLDKKNFWKLWGSECNAQQRWGEGSQLR